MTPKKAQSQPVVSYEHIYDEGIAMW